jgi:hypothetical protein
MKKNQKKTKDGLFSFSDPILNERCGRSAIYLENSIVEKLNALSIEKQIDRGKLADYFLSIGVNTAMHCPRQSVVFNVEEIDE